MRASLHDITKITLGEVEPLRRRQDYVEGLYSRAYSAGGRYLMCKAADRPRLGLSDASRNFQRRSGRP